MDDFEERCAKSAQSILNMLDPPYSNAVVLAALRLAYSTGSRDQQREQIERMVQRDDELKEVSG